ncbi:MAG: MATE family efflux transporter, partial [Odoribacter sp.]|nr:MATE family efflux transporter [Odoribacter sp.]
MSTISNKTIWDISYPIILGNLAQTLIVLIDTAFLGRVSEVALGASIIAGIYYYVFTTLAWGFSIGVQIIIARRLGEGKLKRIGVIFEHGMIFVFFLSIALFFLQHFFTERILQLIISSPNIYEAALEFMNYRHYGIFFVCFYFLFRALYIGLSNTKIITYTTLIMAGVNIFLDYSLIFGNFGFPKMGIGGAALASVWAEVAAFLFCIGYTFFRLPIKEYALFAIHKIEGWLVKAILQLAFPAMVQKLLSFGTWFLFFILVEHMGETPIAVSGIVRSAYMLIMIPVFAFAATANTLTSRLIGEGKQDEVLPTLFKTLKLSLICILLVLLFCLFFPSLILSIYTNNIALISASISTLYVVCIAAVTMGFGNIYFEAVSGTGNTTHALWLETIILAIYLGWIWFLARVLVTNIEWVWTCEIVYGFSIGVLSYFYIKYAPWRRKII